MKVIEAVDEGRPVILFEVADGLEAPAGGALAGKLEGRTADAVADLKKVSASVADLCKTFQGEIEQRLAASKPDELQLQFGVVVGGEGSAIVTKVSAQASMTVTATWRFK
jgi:hypothetical protein